ncbi:MAG: SRPBCC domain-containing protein [Rhizobiales bacterium]|nr:SRPBCC domain-containing protein [Hyphomicrobiales bacterium]
MAPSTGPITPSLTIKRRLNASAEKVYAAWTDPERIVRWWGPSNAAETHHVETDVRVGGRFRIIFRDTDGEDHDVRGVYREVVPNERLVFTWAWRTTLERESLVTVALKPDGEATLLTLVHEQFFDEAARDRHNWGWTGAIDKLERLFV